MKQAPRISRHLAVAIWLETRRLPAKPFLKYKPLFKTSKNNQMERNTVTIASHLLSGDIFYRQNDKDKRKLRVHVHKDGPLTRDRRIVCVEAGLPERLADKPHLQKWLKPNDQVVFLRRPDPSEKEAMAHERIK